MLRDARAALVTASAGLVLILGGCADPIPVSSDVLDEVYYTRVLLRADGNRLHSSNYLNSYGGYKPGSELDITMFSAIRVDLKINGVPHQMFPIGEDFNTGAIEEWVNKYCVRSPAELGLDDEGELEDGGEGDEGDEEPGGADSAEELGDDAWDLRTFKRSIRSNVESGIAAIGMTKAQVYMALGPPAEIDFGTVTAPLPFDTIFNSNRWVYYTNGITPWWFQKVYTFSDGELIQVEQ